MTNKGRYTALLDANILFSAKLRDIFMEVALAKLYRPRWTADIHQEWIESLLRRKPYLDRKKLECTRDLMDRTIPTALVTGHESLIDALSLPDANDRHILAAAVAGRCDVIVTQNVKHFPQSELASLGLEAQHPDEFLANHLDLAPGRFCRAIGLVRVRLQNPPYSVEEFLTDMTSIGLVVTASELQQYAELLA